MKANKAVIVLLVFRSLIDHVRLSVIFFSRGTKTEFDKTPV